MLPFNFYFDATRLHPDGEIDLSYSDDLGRHWVKGNGGVTLEPPKPLYPLGTPEAAATSSSASEW